MTLTINNNNNNKIDHIYNKPHFKTPVNKYRLFTFPLFNEDKIFR